MDIVSGLLTRFAEEQRSDGSSKEREHGSLSFSTATDASPIDIIPGIEAAYTSLVESLSDALLILDVDRVIVSCNQAFLDLFLYEPGEVDGKSVRILHLSKESFFRFGEMAYPVIAREKAFRTEWDMGRKDGTILPVETITSAIFGADGSLQGYVAVMRDITQRRQADETLRRSEKSLRTIMDSVHDAIFVHRADGSIIDVNNKMLELYGVTRGEAMEYSIARDYSGPQNSVDDLPHLWALAMSGKEQFFEWHARRPHDGSLFDVEVRLKRIILTGEECVLATVRDISGRKQLESQLFHAQKMEAVGTLAGGIAHDFNNLLMGIEGQVSLMLMRLDPAHPDYQALKSIQTHVSSGSHLTKRLLGFARGGKYETNTMDLREILERASTMFGRAKKEISILEHYQAGLWAVEVDPGQIEQVLLNLYVNAWEAMPDGGRLTIEATNVTVDEELAAPYEVKPGRYVRVAVEDTGTGMDEKTRERIFEPFFTTKGMGRGTGLGLASVYGIIKNHTGFITVHSEKGCGSTFKTYLPASLQSPKQKMALTVANAEAVPLGTERVLLVDDEDMVADVGEKLLTALGYSVLIARNGKEAIDLYQKAGHNGDKVSLVLLDMIMPDMSGRETFEALKAADPGVRVILSSGYSLDGQAAAIMEAGCRAFIQKPFGIDVLSRKLREVLDG